MQAATTSLQMLGCFQFTVGKQVAQLPLQAQRLLAYLAVTDNPIARPQLAEKLWPFSKHTRAQANLRTALWRVRQEDPNVVTARHEVMELHDAVEVDYRNLLRARSRDELASTESDPRVIAQLRTELLPGWDEEWLMIERERSRQVRMRRLEALSRHYLTSGNAAAAIDAAYASIAIEPLRESAHLALIQAHVEDGNLAEAARQAARLTELVRIELGITPSTQFQDRITDLGLALQG